MYFHCRLIRSIEGRTELTLDTMLRGDSTYEMEGSMMISEDSRQDNLLTAIAMVITDLLVVNENCSGDDRCYHPAAIPKGKDILNFVLK